MRSIEDEQNSRMIIENNRVMKKRLYIAVSRLYMMASHNVETDSNYFRNVNYTFK